MLSRKILLGLLVSSFPLGFGNGPSCVVQIKEFFMLDERNADNC